MNKWLKVVGMLIVVGLLSCSSSEKKEQVSELATKPDSKDELQALMSKTQANMDYLLYGIMNFDQVKVNTSVDNLARISEYLAQQTKFQSRGSAAEWESMCLEQQTAAVSIKEHYAKQDYDKATIALGKLVNSCVNCHKPYRFIK